MPDPPAIPETPAVPTAPAPRPPQVRYSLAEASVESTAPKRVNLATGPVTVAPVRGTPGGADLRTALMKALLRGGLKIKDLESADRVLAAFRRDALGTSTDLYGLFSDVVLAAPSTVGGWLIWPEVLEIRLESVDPGGEPTFDEEALKAWKSDVRAFEGTRRERLEAAKAEIDRYRREFEAALDVYQHERGLLQRLNDGDKGPSEREAYREQVSRAEAHAGRMASLRAEAPESTAAAAERAPQRLNVHKGKARFVVYEARTGETVAIHDVAAEASSREALLARLVEAATKAMGVKR